MANIGEEKKTLTSDWAITNDIALRGERRLKATRCEGKAGKGKKDQKYSV